MDTNVLAAPSQPRQFILILLLSMLFLASTVMFPRALPFDILSLWMDVCFTMVRPLMDRFSVVLLLFQAVAT
jgi:hypothetical protein